jgi:sulfite reductase (NADPH) flavoprotein alpha-component
LSLNRTMNTVPIIPESAPFNEEQRAWLNGFLAGLLSKSEIGSTPRSDGPTDTKRPLLIAFGSQSGNAESLAKKLGKVALTKGFTPKVAGLDNVEAADFISAQNVLVITSTWGEGEMPDNAQTFWETLNQNGSSPQFTGVKFSVLALGDMNYGDTFCLAGRKLDERFEQLGAQRIYPRVDCDVDFDELAKAWTDGALRALTDGTITATIAESTVPKVEEKEVGYSKKNPFAAKLITNIKLNGEGSAKDTRHIGFSLVGSGLVYEAGDALGVLTQNCPDVVAKVISSHQLNAKALVILPDGGQSELHEALQYHYEIRSLLGKTVDKPLSEIDFVDGLKKLQPRLYSIASSLKAHPEEVHLCIGLVKYEKDGVHHKGVASSFLAERLALGETTGVFVHTAKHFRVPANGDTPIIMVGPGTGIAPFRAFLEERQATGAKGNNWLFFGDQKSATDFLYREQIQLWQNDGFLTRLDLAFSRDQIEKIYVQTQMLENAAELWKWLEDGAYFYVCGDASRMAKDVDAALHRIVEQCGGKSPDEAIAYIADLKKAKRYARDVY